MALNFLDTVKSYFNGEFSNQAANSLPRFLHWFQRVWQVF
jgi:hypothetical protein